LALKREFQGRGGRVDSGGSKGGDGDGRMGTDTMGKAMGRDGGSTGTLTEEPEERNGSDADGRGVTEGGTRIGEEGLGCLEVDGWD
jgi:hypothetical protein